ncbi:MAG: amidohydrolase [Cyanobacteriota/Melainabacteria group bacterium]
MLVQDLLERTRLLQEEITEWRRALHAIPEPGFAEHKTADFLAEKLHSFGYQIKRGVARTGVVAELGEGRPRIGIRSEIDGYPVQENLNLAFASRNQGLMHACGHDANMACVMGAAKLLAESGALDGSIKILMQPSSESISEEDNKSGSNKFVEEGVLDDLDYLISFHVDATIISGNAGVLSNRGDERSESFSIMVDGGAGQAMAIASEIVVNLFESTKDQTTFKELLEVDSIQRQSPERALVRGRFTNLGRDTHKFFDNALKASCQAATQSCGHFELSYDNEQALFLNCDTVVKVVEQEVVSLLGEDRCKVVQRKAWSDDFFPYSSRVPSALLFLGVGLPSTPRILHTASFDVDESVLHMGTALIYQSVLSLLQDRPDFQN